MNNHKHKIAHCGSGLPSNQTEAENRIIKVLSYYMREKEMSITAAKTILTSQFDSQSNIKEMLDRTVMEANNVIINE